jgi:hypothetical protein
LCSYVRRAAANKKSGSNRQTSFATLEQNLQTVDFKLTYQRRLFGDYALSGLLCLRACLLPLGRVDAGE